MTSQHEQQLVQFDPSQDKELDSLVRDVHKQPDHPVRKSMIHSRLEGHGQGFPL